MFETLIIFSTTDGQTKKICDQLINYSKNQNTIKILPLSKAFSENISSYQKIIIGASIRYGKHSTQLLEFSDLNSLVLNKKNSAFFSVNVVARKKEKNTALTNPYVKKFLKKTQWKPKKVAVFAGKVDYPNYRFFDKHIIRFIMWLTKGPTDISKTYEFTDWIEVKKFAEIINKM